MATAAGGLRQEAESTVTITEPAVKLDAAGPKTRYVNTPARYEFTVRNTGTCMLNNVVLRQPMPAGTTVLRTTAGGRFDGKAVQWWLGSMPPGTMFKVLITWQTPQAGRVALHPVVSADPGQTVQADIGTEFIAASGLSLSVADRDDPLELKEKTAYQIKVVNRGQVPATNVAIRGGRAGTGKNLAGNRFHASRG